MSALRRVPRTGVIYVTETANQAGFDGADPDWCNLGQGMPETDPLPGDPPRKSDVHITAADHEYAPVGGLPELRAAVADLMNRRFRKGMRSQYSAENVAISGGGRVSLMRVCAAIGPVHLGHFLPDYTAYTELLDVFRRFSPIPILLDPAAHYKFSATDLRKEILGRGLGALLLSNPCNPTGKAIAREELSAWTDVARELDATMIFDEFYSHFYWQGEGPMSAARYVEDVDSDPIVIVDGLTKNWRYPGWRVTWVVGPRDLIESVTSAGSFLDGGANRPLQRAAVDLLDENYAAPQDRALRKAFMEKRDFMQAAASRIGLTVEGEIEGTFYLWANLSELPAPLQDGHRFFEEALKRKVICVPGTFFDVDPGARRKTHPSRFANYVRLSFGPSLKQITKGMQRIEEMVHEV